MRTRSILFVRIGNRQFRAIRAAELVPGEVPLSATQAWGLLEREFLRPRDLPTLQRLSLAITGIAATTQLRAIREAFHAGRWALLTPISETSLTPIQAPEPVAEQLKSAKAVKTWIEMEVVDDFGRPQPNQPFLCMLPDGRIETGTLDDRGRVRFDGIDPGTCVFTLTNLDQETWAKAA